jgi:purine-binding chemotaxis protein CheW
MSTSGNGQVRAKARAAANVDMQKLVIFQLGVDSFAAAVLSVERVLRYSPPNSVPDVPGWIEGVLEHRGKVIPVVDLRRRIELADVNITPRTRILVFVTALGWVAGIVDAVHEVVAMPTASIAPPPPLLHGIASDFVTGIVRFRERLVVVLDVERVLASSDRITFDDIMTARTGEALAVRG